MQLQHSSIFIIGEFIFTTNVTARLEILFQSNVNTPSHFNQKSRSKKSLFTANVNILLTDQIKQNNYVKHMYVYTEKN